MAENKNETGRLAPPRHIAIIMDGNGRWATRRGLPRTAGHKAGAETFRKIATYCKDIGVKYLTVYAFSTENWKRSETEVSAIMALLKKYLLEAVDTMERDHIRLHFFGDMTPIAPELRALARETDEITEHLSKDDFQANVCLNYGGRDEILRAARRFAEDCAEGRRRPEELDEALFSEYLDSRGIPDPELVQRLFPQQRPQGGAQPPPGSVFIFRHKFLRSAGAIRPGSFPSFLASPVESPFFRRFKHTLRPPSRQDFTLFHFSRPLDKFRQVIS